MGQAQRKVPLDPIAVRRDFARSVVDLYGSGLEFGVYDRPTFDPKIVNLKFLDYYSTEELKARATASFCPTCAATIEAAFSSGGAMSTGPMIWLLVTSILMARTMDWACSTCHQTT